MPVKKLRQKQILTDIKECENGVIIASVITERRFGLNPGHSMHDKLFCLRHNVDASVQRNTLKAWHQTKQINTEYGT